MTKQMLLFLAIALIGCLRPQMAEAQYICKQPTCLAFGGPVKPAQPWIVGELKMLAFGEDSKEKIMTELMAQGWVECAGQPLPRSKPFDRLFNEISDTWGSGDGKTDYYLPDLRGMFVRGWNHGRDSQLSAKTIGVEKVAVLPLGGDPDTAARQAPRPEICSARDTGCYG